ncbi:MAG: hypothetical protein KDD50_07560 [Bdellovibrionales bacterium]|nr:hypothetical protein [Bdellovibrionales bacterium]
MKKIKEYDDPKLFWQEISGFLKKEEAKNSLCLGLSYMFQTHPKNCLYQSALFDDDKFLGSLVLSKYKDNANLLPSPVKDADVAKELLAVFNKRNHLLSGVVGEKNSAELYRQHLETQDKKTKTLMTQGIYKCTKVNFPKNDRKITFRKAEEKDIQLISDWMEGFHQEATPHDPVLNWMEAAQSKINSQMIYLVEKDNLPVSMAAWSRDIETSCSVNLVYTPNHYRKQGFASLVTALLTQKLLESGKKETNLYTDMTNPSSNKIYRDIGYQLVADSIHFSVLS